MKAFLRKKEVWMDIAAILLLVLCVAGTVAVHVRPGLRQPMPAMNPFFVLRPEKMEEETIPDYAGIRRTYVFTLPDLNHIDAANLRLMVYLRHMYASFTLKENEFRYEVTESDHPHIGHTPGKYWLNIPIRPEYSGMTARLTLTPVYGDTAGPDPEFLLIERDTLLSSIVLPHDQLLLMLTVFAVIAGLLLIVFTLFFPLRTDEKRRLYYSGAVTITAGLWKMSCLPMVPLLLDSMGMHKEIWYGGVFSYLLMLVLSLRMMAFYGKQQPIRAEHVCFGLAAGCAALLMALQALGVLELYHAVIWFGLGIGLMHLYCLIRKRAGRSEWLWMAPFFLTMAFDILSGPLTGNANTVSAFLIWSVLNLILRGFGFILNALKLERELRRREKELHQAKITALMNQIQPHFISNVLSSIYVLCKEDADKAAEMINDFTGYLQTNYTLIAGAGLTSFAEELEHTRAYLSIVSLLYEDKLKVEYDIAFSAFRLPSMTLQPLVENAVKFTVGKGRVPGRLLIRTRKCETGAEISVEDNGPGYAPAQDSQPHIGLQNVRERLQLMCGGTLTVASLDGGGTRVTVLIL